MSPGGEAPARSNLSVGSAGAGAPGLSPCPGLDRAAPPSPRRDPSTLPWIPLPRLWVRMGPSGPPRGGLLLPSLDRALCCLCPDAPAQSQTGPSIQDQWRTGPNTLPRARPQHPGPQASSQARTHSAKAVAPLMPKATGMASREGVSTAGTAGSCIPSPAATARARGLRPRCRRQRP